MEFRVLGDVDVLVDGRSVRLGARKQRLLLAVLLCHAGRTVPVGQLIDSLWATPPASAAGNLRVYVHQLRRILGPSRITGSGRPGYTAVVAPDELDAARFVELVAAARQALADRQDVAARQHATSAIELWHGDPFADLRAEPALRDESARLEQCLLTAADIRADAELRLGDSAAVLDELPALIAGHPFHEGLRHHLMTALVRAGRRAEALAEYARVRTLFAEELGTEPGARLRELHEAVLRDELRPTPRPDPVPAQLPADVAVVVGRQACLDRLDEIAAGGTRRLVVLFGTAGVGKTTLAVHWAHRVRHRFPDGQLSVDLHGHGTGDPLSTVDALTCFVRALGVPADRTPVAERELVALYRSLLATRRMLVLLDNAGSADVVRGLLPGAGASMVVVTSRGPLRALCALDDAVAVHVAPLAAADSVRLLDTVLDGHDIGGAGLADLATLCAHLPLALRIAATNLTGRTTAQAEEFMRVMRGDRLGRLRIDDEPPAVRAAFQTSYATLPARLREVFQLVGAAPVRDISEPAAAALLAGEPEPALARLVHAGLADRLPAGRYRLHDLLRCYATELVDTYPADALCRLLSFYHRTTLNAVAAAVRGRTRLAQDPAHPDVRPLSFDDADSATAWLAEELANLVAVCAAVVDSPHRRIAWQIADAMRDYFWIHRYGKEWLAIGHSAVAAGVAAADPAALLASHNGLGIANWCLSRYTEAVAQFRHAIRVGGEVAPGRGVAGALANLGGVYRETGDLDAARTHCVQAVAMYVRIGDSSGIANTWITLSGVALDMGRFAEATEHAELALAHYRTVDRPDGQGSALLLISEAAVRSGQADAALRAAEDAAALLRAAGTRQGEACALLCQAVAHVAVGRPAAAEPLARAALAVGQDTGSAQLTVEALACLADVTLDRGDPRAALAEYVAVAGQARRIGLRVAELAALIGQARAWHALSDPTAARRPAAEALRLAEDGGYRWHAGRARDVLAVAVA